ncbi:glycosyltransferase [Ancylomarina sp. 16SWW S1-10-2]|uniref:glycosyltransferase n=1 Tax=Ancylomarina sp. 16SWW S1-10-2 TaxID=2499681 RepID=UPI0012AE5F28|nr:glycosyltransferase [Ancylomarina sp. 16SWW S1-10-2]MRT94809.1 glycosyltransferase [Ancylomarina sp. 16SWW S1-10-2]
MNMPIVTVACTTYNQEKYIAETIEGFLNQVTNFQIEIIIHDDASTDNTANIVVMFAKRYPKLIFPIFQKENQYSKGIKPWPNFVFPKAKGKYIALCEGDDFWTDPYKLQKQVDFLEANSDYGMVHTNYSVYNESKKTLRSNSKKKIISGDVFRSLIVSGNNIATLTVLARAELIKKASMIINAPSLSNKWAMGDYPMWLSIAQQSKIAYLNDNTSVYRKLNDSASNSLDGNKELTILKSLCSIGRWFSKEYGEDDCLPVINENELFIGYHLSLVFNKDDRKDYRRKVRSHKIINKSVRNRLLRVISYSIVFDSIFSFIRKRR